MHGFKNQLQSMLRYIEPTFPTHSISHKPKKDRQGGLFYLAAMSCSTSTHVQTAIEREVCTGRITAVIRCNPRNDGRDFFRCA
jgi:hypothetical protein